jgi:hypothetical protein
MKSYNKIIMYISVIALAISLLLNPTIDDFKAEVESSNATAGGTIQFLTKALTTVGNFQIGRRNFIIFCVFKTQYKSFVKDSQSQYYVGVLGQIVPIKQGDLKWLCKGNFKENSKM